MIKLVLHMVVKVVMNPLWYFFHFLLLLIELHCSDLLIRVCYAMAQGVVRLQALYCRDTVTHNRPFKLLNNASVIYEVSEESNSRHSLYQAEEQSRK